MKKKEKNKSKDPNEIIAFCLHPDLEHRAKYQHINRYHAHHKCLKKFNDPCKHYVPKG